MAKKSKLKLNLSPNNLLSCLFYAVVGILLVILKGGSLGLLMTVTGALLVILGLVAILKEGDLVKGVVLVAAGIAIIIFGWTIADVVLLILGILLIIKGVLDLLKVFKNGFLSILPALITIVVGVLLVISKWALLDVMCVIAGVIFIVNAVLVLFGKNMVRKKKK